MSTKKLQIIGGNFGGNSIQTDDTLTKIGHAADAKATGDAILKLQTDIDEIAGLVGDTDVEYYTEEEIDSMMAGLSAAIDAKSNVDHIHDEYADANHNHSYNDLTDVYVLNEEPTDASEGALWIDMDAESADVGGGTSVLIDTTLTQSGFAADAKAVGDALATKQPIGDYAAASALAALKALVGDTSVSEQIKTELESLNNTQPDHNQNDPTAADYIKNRLAWTEPGEIITYTFDGNLDGKEYIYLEEESTDAHKNYLVKINDKAISLDSFEALELYTGIIQKIPKNMLSIKSIGTSWAAVPGDYTIPVIVSAEGVEAFGSTLFGTYVFYGTEKLGEVDSPSVAVSAVYCSTPEIVHKLDPKYLPDGGFGYDDPRVLLADIELEVGSLPCSMGDVGGRIGLEVGKTYTIVLDSGTYSCVCKETADSRGEVFYLGNLGMLNSTFNATGEHFLIYEAREDVQPFPYRTYAFDVDKGTKCTVYSGGEIHKIDPKYYDRLAWVEDGSGEILPETTITTVDNQYIIMNFIGLTDGSKYTVTFDGIEYKTECAITNIEGIDVRYIGNIALFTGDEASDTGEHFIIGELPIEGMEVTGIMTMLDDGEHTVSISGGVEIIHKVDPKFLHTPDMEAAAGEPGYIANKPFGKTYRLIEILPDTNFSGDEYQNDINENISMEDWLKVESVVVNLDGNQYEFSPLVESPYDFFEGYNELVCGSLNLNPFLLSVNTYRLNFMTSSYGEHTVNIKLKLFDYSPIDYHYFHTATLSFDLNENKAEFTNEQKEELKQLYGLIQAGYNVYAMVSGVKVAIYDISGGFNVSTHGKDWITIKMRSLDNLIDYTYKRDAIEDLPTTTITETLIQPQADYAQNDETKPDYVKNRLAWTEPRTTIMPLTTVEIITDSVGIENDIGLTEGQYIVTWDGVEYEVDCVNRSITDSDGIVHDMFVIDNTPVFYIYYMPTLSTSTIGFESSANGYASGTYTCQIDKPEVIHQINSKYIPDTIATNDYVDNAIAKIPTPDVSGQIAEHDINANAHSDIREAIGDLQTRVGDTLDALPVKVDKDGYTDIDGLRKTTSMDFSEYDEGVFYETVSGRTERYVYNIEFDDQKRPIKITDENGNECIITW